jgi:DMSO/TMAO reductase YedYZ molybdopterin-dependent catalytic subunit
MERTAVRRLSPPHRCRSDCKYVGFQWADGYTGSIDMASALNTQTVMAVKFADETLPAKFGYR